jgi:anti-sigma B factor antagonist
MAATPRISLTEADGVPVIQFLERRLFDEPSVRDVSDQLFAALPRDGKPIALIVDFANVEMISSAMLGKVILLQRRIDSTGGRLCLCSLRPAVQDVLRTTNLDRLFRVVRDRREAREAFGTPPARA